MHSSLHRKPLIHSDKLTAQPSAGRCWACEIAGGTWAKASPVGSQALLVIGGKKLHLVLEERVVLQGTETARVTGRKYGHSDGA